MTEDSEPASNIAGTTTGEMPASSTAGDPATRAEAVVDRLGELYWQKTYGGQDAFACLVRTILSQNTSDTASQPAFDALLDRFGGESRLATRLATADLPAIAETIQPAGLHNRKADVIKAAAETVVEEYGDGTAFDRFVRTEARERVRETLLSLDGVGPKTADCVLLFAGGAAGVFPVDTHVHRIYRRLGVAAADADHETVRATLEAAVPAAKCGFGHTASIQFGREYCTARDPACLDGPEACPLAEMCEQVGVDPESGVVVDPADVDEVT
ncbi:MAG: endonuclease III [Halobacteriaceae archaeon]